MSCPDIRNRHIQSTCSEG